MLQHEPVIRKTRTSGREIGKMTLNQIPISTNQLADLKAASVKTHIYDFNQSLIRTRIKRSAILEHHPLLCFARTLPSQSGLLHRLVPRMSSSNVIRKQRRSHLRYLSMNFLWKILPKTIHDGHLEGRQGVYHLSQLYRNLPHPPCTPPAKRASKWCLFSGTYVPNPRFAYRISHFKSSAFPSSLSSPGLLPNPANISQQVRLLNNLVHNAWPATLHKDRSTAFLMATATPGTCYKSFTRKVAESFLSFAP